MDIYISMPLAHIAHGIVFTSLSGWLRGIPCLMWGGSWGRVSLAVALSHLPLGRRQTVSCSCNEFLTQMFVAHTDNILFGYFQRLRGRHFGLAFNISFFVFKSIFSLMYSSFSSLSRYHTVIAYLETHFWNNKISRCFIIWSAMVLFVLWYLLLNCNKNLEKRTFILLCCGICFSPSLPQQLLSGLRSWHNDNLWSNCHAEALLLERE